MNPNPNRKDKKQSGISLKSRASLTEDSLRHLAFDNSFQANIISRVSNGKILIANSAACKLLGYSKKEIVTKNRASIFDIDERSFKKMLQQRTASGHSIALVSVIKKNGKSIYCEITSAVFIGEHGIEKSITTIADASQSLLEQKKIDTKKEKIVAGNIVLAKSNQKKIDTKKEKIVAGNIVLAKSKQKKIDTRKEKIVADNIILAKSKQKKIDTKKEKIVADNIVLAKSKQTTIDTKNEKIVADNIVLAKSIQTTIDIKNEKIVADNIIEAQEKSDARLIENNEWIKTIAKTSYDVMWDWDIFTNKIYVGDSIKEIFGYKVQNNIVSFADFSSCILPEEKDAVENKLFKALSSDSNNWNDTFQFKRLDGSIASTTSRACIMRDEEGKVTRLIGATQDISMLHALEKKLEDQIAIQDENSEKFVLANKLSFDVIWDWNILTNEMFIGDGFEEMYGYKIIKNKGNLTDWINYLYPDDKEAVEKRLDDAIKSSATHWEQAYRFIRADGSIAKAFSKASIIRYADGKAYRMLGTMKDLSLKKELEEKLKSEIASRAKLLTQYKESFKFIFNSSSDVFYDHDLLDDKVIISDSYEKEFGYKITKIMTPAKDWLSHIHPDDKEALMKDYSRVIQSKDLEWKYRYRFLRSDGTVADVISSVIILRNNVGKAYRLFGYMQDMNKQKVVEERLEHDIKLKEAQIAEATEEARENERSDIGKELHDNVNQLLAASKLYLDIAKQGGEHSEVYLNRSSEYTITAIEEIRKLSKGLTTDTIKNLGLCVAIDNICRDTMQVKPVKISCALDSFIEESENDKFKLNVFRIVQEQLNNILKHAKATKIIINLSQNKKSTILFISDNGIGFDTAQKTKGIGIDNIKSRAASYSGTADLISQPGQGCNLTVTFPVTDKLSK